MRFHIAAALAVALAGQAHAQVFEVIHPDVEEGQLEFEVLNTVVLDGIAVGDERTVHEVALGFAPVDFWKTTIALELVNTRGNGGALEAFEWENVFLLPFGGHGHGDDDHDHDGAFFELGAVGLYAALEVPAEVGIREGGAAIGPIAEFGLGPVEVITNLFVDIPFEDGVDPGLAYALSAAVPVGDVGPMELAAGFEAHGGVEELFGNGTPLGQNGHFVGPAIYTGFELPDGKVIEPRLALLFGVSTGAPDAALSFNIEFKY